MTKALVTVSVILGKSCGQNDHWVMNADWTCEKRKRLGIEEPSEIFNGTKLLEILEGRMRPSESVVMTKSKARKCMFESFR
jgi:hypothetical protein